MSIYTHEFTAPEIRSIGHTELGAFVTQILLVANYTSVNGTVYFVDGDVMQAVPARTAELLDMTDNSPLISLSIDRNSRDQTTLTGYKVIAPVLALDEVAPAYDTVEGSFTYPLGAISMPLNNKHRLAKGIHLLSRTIMHDGDRGQTPVAVDSLLNVTSVVRPIVERSRNTPVRRRSYLP